jgi:hypothetical protein
MLTCTAVWEVPIVLGHHRAEDSAKDDAENNDKTFCASRCISLAEKVGDVEIHITGATVGHHN